MKKFFTLVVAAFAALTMNAAVEVAHDNFQVGTAISLNGGWDGKWANLSEDVNFDGTDYDYVWIQFKDASGKIAFGLTYSEWLKKESWGDVFYDEKKMIESVTSGVIGIKLNKTKVYEKGNAETGGQFVGDRYDKHLRQIFIQDQGVKSGITVEGVWFGSTEEYEAAVAGNKPQVNPIKELDPKAATGGWGDKEFDPATCTATIVGKNAAPGWWLDMDASNYDNFVCELTNITIPESLAEDGTPDTYFKVKVQYGDDSFSDSESLSEGDCTVVVPLNPEQKGKVKQVVFQGTAGIKFTIKSAYFATAEKTPSTSISNVWTAPADKSSASFNLAGQQVNASYKGVVIKNGKKFVQK